MDDATELLPLRLLVVIVLYKVKPNDCITLLTLQAAKSKLDPKRANIQILLYDNTPGGQNPVSIPADVRYIADRKNGGLAKAYNYSREVAKSEGLEWLLTLDQDTSLADDFLIQLCHDVSSVIPLTAVAAVVPQVVSDGRVLSPWVPTKHWALVKRFADGYTGVPPGPVYAANSASTIRVSALETISGYDCRFRLDFSDLVMYHRLQSHHFKVFVAGNIRVEHELSGFDLKNRSNPGRYIDFHAAEEAFYDEYLGTLSGMVLQLRMLHRILYKLWRQGGSFQYFKISLRFFCRRLFRSRRYRRATWASLSRKQIA